MECREKPDCKVFLLAAVRKLRKNQANLENGRAAGAEIQKIFECAQELYLEEEIRKSLQALMDEKKVAVTIRGYFRENRGGIKKHVGDIHQRISILPALSFDQRVWNMDVEMRREVDPEKVDDHAHIRTMHIYLVEDGLPKCIEVLPGKDTYSSVVQEILDSMEDPLSKLLKWPHGEPPFFVCE